MNWKNLFRRNVGNDSMYFHIDNLEVGNLSVGSNELVVDATDLVGKTLTTEQKSSLENAIAVCVNGNNYAKITYIPQESYNEGLESTLAFGTINHDATGWVVYMVDSSNKFVYSEN